MRNALRSPVRSRVYASPQPTAFTGPQRGPYTPHSVALNGLLEQLSSPQQQAQLDLKAVSLTRGQVLLDQGERASLIYFPTTSVISMIASFESADSVEVASVGREGMTSAVDAWLGSESASRLVVQIPGQAYATTASALLGATSSSDSFGGAALAYACSLYTMMAQAAACYRHHTVRQQCARWLLLNQARLCSESIPVTHELLAETLGVFRPTISIALGELQDRRLIHVARGRVYVLDSRGLEAAACHCSSNIRQDLLKALGIVTPIPRDRRSE